MLVQRCEYIRYLTHAFVPDHVLLNAHVRSEGTAALRGFYCRGRTTKGEPLLLFSGGALRGFYCRGRPTTGAAFVVLFTAHWHRAHHVANLVLY